MNNSAGLRQTDTTYNSDDQNPAGSPTVANPSPFVHVMAFELAKLRSDAQSLYYDSNSDAPDYLTPIINPIVQDGGASIALTWSGSNDGIVEDVPFTASIDAVDEHRFIRFRVAMQSNIFTGARARIELLEIPFQFP